MVPTLPDVPPRDVIDGAKLVLGASAGIASTYAAVRKRGYLPVPHRLALGAITRFRIDNIQHHDPEVTATLLPSRMDLRLEGLDIAPSKRSSARVSLTGAGPFIHDLVVTWVDAELMPGTRGLLRAECRRAAARFVAATLLDELKHGRSNYLLDADAPEPPTAGGPAMSGLIEDFAAIRSGSGRSRCMCRELAIMERIVKDGARRWARERYLMLLYQFNTGRGGVAFDNVLASPVTGAYVVGVSHNQRVSAVVDDVERHWYSAEPRHERVYLLGRGPLGRLAAIHEGVLQFLGSSSRDFLRDPLLKRHAGDEYALRLALVPTECR